MSRHPCWGEGNSASGYVRPRKSVTVIRVCASTTLIMMAGVASIKPAEEITVPAATSARYWPAVEPMCPLPRRSARPHRIRRQCSHLSWRPVCPIPTILLRLRTGSTPTPLPRHTQTCCTRSQSQSNAHRSKTSTPHLAGCVPSYLTGFQTCVHSLGCTGREPLQLLLHAALSHVGVKTGKQCVGCFVVGLPRLARRLWRAWALKN